MNIKNNLAFLGVISDGYCIIDADKIFIIV